MFSSLGKKLSYESDTRLNYARRSNHISDLVYVIALNKRPLFTYCWQSGGLNWNVSKLRRVFAKRDRSESNGQLNFQIRSLENTGKNYFKLLKSLSFFRDRRFLSQLRRRAQLGRLNRSSGSNEFRYHCRVWAPQELNSIEHTRQKPLAVTTVKQQIERL